MRTITESSIIFTSFLINQLFYRKRLPPPSDIQKILVVKLDHIGDVLLATPAIANLRLQYPHAHIAMMVGSWSKQVIECNPHIDEILCYDSPFFRRLSASPQNIGRLIASQARNFDLLGLFPNKFGRPRLFRLKAATQMLRRLKSERYDLIVELRGDFLSLALAMLKGGKYRLDRSMQRVLKKLRTIFKDSKPAVRRSRPLFLAYSEHEVEINLDVLRSGDIPITSRKTVFNVLSKEQAWAKSFLSELGIDASKPIVAIHPGSPVPLKRWPAERFAKLADILIERKTQVLFLGGADEKQLVEEIQSQMRYNSANIAGRTNLQQLGAVLQNCHLFIGNDSGPMHIAAAVGTRVIGLFGPGSPQRFGPFGDNCTSIRKKPDCPPCMKEKCRFGEEGCIVEISVEDVVEFFSKKFV